MNDRQRFALDVMRRQLEELRGLVARFPTEFVDWEPRGAWSLRTHLHHMRHTEQRYLDRLEGVLASPDYVLPPAELPPTDPEEDTNDIVAGYALRRERAMAIFEDLKDDQWSTTFNHPTVWGDVTLTWWAERLVHHTADHLQTLWMRTQLATLTPEARRRLSA